MRLYLKSEKISVRVVIVSIRACRFVRLLLFRNESCEGGARANAHTHTHEAAASNKIKNSQSHSPIRTLIRRRSMNANMHFTLARQLFSLLHIYYSYLAFCEMQSVRVTSFNAFKCSFSISLWCAVCLYCDYVHIRTRCDRHDEFQLSLSHIKHKEQNIHPKIG